MSAFGSGRTLALLAATVDVAAVATVAFFLGACSFTQDFATPSVSAYAPDATSGPALSDGSACARTDDDPSNCGTCGHSCLGGACSAGRCEPVVLAAHLGDSGGDPFFRNSSDGGTCTGPTSIVTDATHVYWLNGVGALMRIPLGGGSPEPFADLAAYLHPSAKLVMMEDAIIAGPSPSPAGWDGNALVRVTKATRSSARLFDDRRSVAGFALTATDLFVAARIATSTAGDPLAITEVYRCPLTGCATAPARALDATLRSSLFFDGLAANDAYFFVATSDFSGANHAPIETFDRDTGNSFGVVGNTAVRYGTPVVDGLSLYSSNLTYLVETPFDGAVKSGGFIDVPLTERYVASGTEVGISDSSFVLDKDFF